MTNEELLQDLKQFVEAKVNASEERLLQKMATKDDLKIMATKADIQELKSDMDGRFDTVLEAVGERFESTDAVVREHERRITRLERRAV
ncbi:hypothetical protein [Umezawaea sp. Da 62-37]|uniref:hypothetical protein n=1 Tax=Umezawaea sp. Da 62-37 TaxID=3075927 RepID=UPI0028F74EEE|nr:hypothetical protein [Umezawaea sp. Da 62-37]WNV83457.1 hypothetical protein RM788_35500 [Umezawaea sp. Da 62-37]